ncbi:hypothetical protein K2Z84_08165 [Candidatus Binatia bacterium]|jgi:hypothetical protein|nr:hypothetical protein [Candidatus Binatia bacterium]
MPSTNPTPRPNHRAAVTLIAAALLTIASPALDARAAPDADACAAQIVSDLRGGKLEAVAKLLLEPPSYTEEQAAQDREGSVAGLRAVLETVGGIEEATPMAGRRRYYRVQISGGTPEAWSTVGRPMATGIVERDIRFGRAGRGVLVVKLAKGPTPCGIAMLDLGLDADQPEARDKMIDVFVAVLQALGAEDDAPELRRHADSMLTTYDAGTAVPAAPSAGGVNASQPAPGTR